LKAKVFISCGQRPDEEPIVKRIEETLQELKFDTFVAKRQSSPKGLAENIFRELDDSEYFLFIDFRREELKPEPGRKKGKQKKGWPCRGSLYTNQELAIASYLGLDLLGFQEEGVLPLDGMIGSIMLNCQQFSNRNELPDLVHKKILDHRWNPGHKAKLFLNREAGERGGDLADKPYIYHIEVTNLHWRRPALDCRAYLDKVTVVSSGKQREFQKFELKWAGTTLPGVTIMPQERRSFDAFVIWLDQPTLLCWSKGHSFADTDKVWPKVTEAGKYRITYLVTSFNFPPLLGTFELDLKNSLEEISPFCRVE
jgi:hypothetical protein